MPRRRPWARPPNRPLRRIAFGALAGITLLVVATALWVRLAPSDPADWHVDPLTAPGTGRANAWRVGPSGAAGQPLDAAAPVYAVPAAELARALDAAARAWPRTEPLARSGDGLHLSYVARSRVRGFPDYVSVRVLDRDGGTSTLAIYSRARFGSSDLGVNRARVEAWLDDLSRRLPAVTPAEKRLEAPLRLAQ